MTLHVPMPEQDRGGQVLPEQHAPLDARLQMSTEPIIESWRLLRDDVQMLMNFGGQRV